MKKIISAILLTALIFTLIGCGEKKEKATETFNSDGEIKLEEKDIFVKKSEVLADIDGSEIEGGCDLYSEEAGVSQNGNNIEEIEINAGTLTAGKWNDNKNFDFFKSVLEREEWKAFCDKWSMHPVKRLRVKLSNGQSACKNVICSLKSGTDNLGNAVTNAEGEAYIYYDIKGESNAVPDTLVVGDIGYPVTEKDIESGTVILDCSDGIRYNNLDLMFVIDTTGSMCDELDYLKVELDDVIDKVTKANSGININLGFRFYRDEGDEYVVRDYSLTSDTDTARSFLCEQFSDGGGDFPEAVDKALESALNDGWRTDSIKLMFFVLDAPSHDGTENSLSASFEKASLNGIRIIPIVSSGADTETEFLMRTASAVTGGEYVFLTDDSGVGESHLEPTIGDYDVKALNEMIVNIINSYCN